MEDVTTFAVQFVDGLGASRTATEENARQVADRFVEAEPASASFPQLLAALEAAAAVGFNPLHPGFLGYVPPTGLPIGAIADFVAATPGPLCRDVPDFAGIGPDRVDRAAVDR